MAKFIMSNFFFEPPQNDTLPSFSTVDRMIAIEILSGFCFPRAPLEPSQAMRVCGPGVIPIVDSRGAGGRKKTDHSSSGINITAAADEGNVAILGGFKKKSDRV